MSNTQTATEVPTFPFYISTNEWVAKKNKCLREDGTTYWRRVCDNKECEPPTEEERLKEENEKLKEKVRKCAEGILKIKETMEKMMEATTKSQAEMVGVVEQLHSEAMRASMKLVSAEMSLALLQVENKELRRRLRATEPEGEVEEGGEDYEPDFEWLSELERNR